MSTIIKIKRGQKEVLPTLAVGELGYCIDTNEMYIGTVNGNVATGYKFFSTTINTGDWTGSDPYVATKTISGILSTDTPIVDIVLTGVYEDDLEILEQWGNIYRITASNNNITIYSQNEISIDLPIQLKVVR